MAENIQWIRFIVGTFDGNSFKKIKRAKIGGVSYRDKLTAVWFELLDLAGKCNANGYLIDNNEIPYQSYEDIAVMLDREEKEIELCMQFFINEKMVEIVDDVYCLTNFMQYQNQEGLERIRELKRLRQARWRERKALGLVDGKTSTQTSTQRLLSNSISNSNSNSNYSNILEDSNTSKRFSKPTIEEVSAYCKERENSVDAETFWNFYESKGWKVGNQPMKDWKAAVRTWEKGSARNKSNGWLGTGTAENIDYGDDD